MLYNNIGLKYVVMKKIYFKIVSIKYLNNCHFPKMGIVNLNELLRSKPRFNA